MLQDTVLRLSSIDDIGPVYCICNESHRFLVAEQLRAIDTRIGEIVLEPTGRNTAPAACIAALLTAQKHPDALMLVLPADHVILDPQAFGGAVASGKSAAAKGELVTFGIVPLSPETEYGYIRVSTQREGEKLVYPVLKFVEKPDRETAKHYVAAGDYFWNSGIFLFRADAYLQELETYAPKILVACREALQLAVEDLDFLRLDPEAFFASPYDSIDYAVMEKTSQAALVPLDAGWSDVGAWSVLWDVQERDDMGNVTKGDVLLRGVKNSYIHTTSHLVTAVGLDGCIIVETEDALLVASRDCVQEVKLLVEQLNNKERDEALTHRRVYRPWGSYETVDFSERFKVKRITVNSGAALSLQKHHHRAEHWIVVKGTAIVTVESKKITLCEDQSTYIPIGALHRLENIGNAPLELIEVQTGAYLGEDDIVRVEDRYGRE